MLRKIKEMLSIKSEKRLVTYESVENLQKSQPIQLPENVAIMCRNVNVFYEALMFSTGRNKQ